MPAPVHPLVEYQPPPWAGALAHPPRRRLRLAALPTALQPAAIGGFPDDIDLWVKRDDCTGSTLSGNKVRKLEFLLADALERRCDVVLTCGGVQSNHCRATAVAARELGLDSLLFLRTSDTTHNPGLAGNLLLDRLVGAELKLITPAQYRARHEVMQQHAAELEAEGRRPYIIPEGGSNALGSWGYLEAIRELEEQCIVAGRHFDDIVFACGSGGTAAGLALGARLASLTARIHAVNVCNDATYFFQHINTIFDELGSPVRAEEVLDIVEGYVGRGYALSTAGELAFLRDTARASGIILDPVYTGKALFGLARELEKNRARFGRRILFLHTGGLFGLYDKSDDLAPLLADSAR